MAYPIEDKLVIAIASSALFDLGESNRIFRASHDVEVYRRYQREHEREPFEPGIAFPFVQTAAFAE
jgi:5'-nucleotidase